MPRGIPFCCGKEILEKYYFEDKLPIIQIARKLRASYGAVQNKFKEHQIIVKPRGGRDKIDCSSEELKFLYNDKKLNAKEIGKIFNVGGYIILNRLRRYGINVIKERPWKIEELLDMKELKEKDLRELYLNQDLTLIEIVERLNLNCSVESLKKILKIYKIPLRGRGSRIIPFEKRFTLEDLKNMNGYDFVRCSGHPNANSQGLVRVHVYVASQKLGRKIYKNEHIHHLDGNKSNNEIGRASCRERV